ncbi:hypothetical protein OPV22_029350 [Ensete ventricosum]|uniref:Uncharacterized protein n=1 Tax=Ensete ventricosum TaxID=4639 RepID=A0AAV8Q8Y7_ENSVE|nr:hypothetical protein OPV22_029350 [Ensete ventricosum]
MRANRLCRLQRDKHLLMNMELKFLETSARTNLNVEQVFFSIARDIKQRLAESDNKPEVERSRLTNQTKQLLKYR